MAVVGDRRPGCDGCGRTVPVEDAATIRMPDGEAVVCCPDCAPHARVAAQKGGSLDQRRDACDGCTATVPVADLEDVVLDDGTVVTCCPSCAAEASGYSADDASATDATGSTATGGPGSTNGGDADEQTRCTQCRDRVSEELYRVTTIDERTERLCSDCKADADERGIVAAVAMRKRRAREILGVDADATDEQLRAAYYEQVKRAHPDRKSGSKSAFALVTDAYERLRDGD
ncbi:J domain-containing protein [Natrinema marinum]|uniref:J domain-containing protein n=1 Tax=Natrinema marinum TaxID=2961598 RepID=UPI0020C8B608|nr:J domain-containing protein [Natrinema marinum]